MREQMLEPSMGMPKKTKEQIESELNAADEAVRNLMGDPEEELKRIEKNKSAKKAKFVEEKSSWERLWQRTRKQL